LIEAGVEPGSLDVIEDVSHLVRRVEADSASPRSLRGIAWQGRR
jgi:hypothetical protein